MYKRINLFMVGVLFGACMLMGSWHDAFGQTLRIEGKVSDSTGNGLESVLITLVDSSNELILAFTETDSNGYFSFVPDSNIALSSGRRFFLKVTMLGYESVTTFFTTTHQYYRFVLNKSAIITLPGITVNAGKNVVGIRGDTLLFQVKKWEPPGARTIRDVISQIPGLAITEQGTIQYLGKAINYFYIDGENILGQSYKTAIDNIPVDFVDQVQVIEHNQHIKMLNGIVRSEDPALNIVMTNQARTIWHNDISAGAGSVYDMGWNSMAFKSKFKFFNVSKFNNAGKDYSAEKAQFTIGNNNSIQAIDQQSGMLNTGLTQAFPGKRERYYANNTFLLHSNYFKALSNGYNLRANLAVITNSRTSSYNTYQQYFLPGDTISFFEKPVMQSQSKFMFASLLINRNAQEKYFDYGIQVKLDAADGQNDILNKNGRINAQLKSHELQLASQLKGLLKFKRLILEYGSLLRISRVPENLMVSPDLHKFFLNAGQSYASAEQELQKSSLFVDNYLFLRRPITEKQTLSLRVGLEHQQGHLQSDLSLQDSQGVIKPLTIGFVNRTRAKQTSIGALWQYQKITDKTVFAITVPLQYVDASYNDPLYPQISNTRERFLFSSDIQYRYYVTTENSIKWSGGITNALTHPLANFYGLIMNSYLGFTSNGLPVMLRKTVYTNLGFEQKKPLRSYYLTLQAGYYRHKNEFMIQQVVEQSSVSTIAIPLTNHTDNLILESLAGKYFFRQKINLSGRYTVGFSHTPQYLNQDLLQLYTVSHSAQTKLRIALGNYLQISYQAGFQWSTSKKGTSSLYATNYMNTQETGLQLSNCIPGQFLLQWERTYLHTSAMQPVEYSFIDLGYQVMLPSKRHSFSLEFKCLNLLNTKILSVAQASPLTSSQTSFDLRPRMVVATIGLRL